jgi:aspartate aminotransferase
MLFLAYRDEKGKPWVQPFVLDLENKLLKSVTYNHEYLLFLGMDSFKELAPRLILGEKSPALESGRVS